MITPPFLCLLAAAGIFRLLSADAIKAFHLRLAGLLPRNVTQEHFRVLREDFPDRLAEFRRRVLPFSALHVALNLAACACFGAAVWLFLPSGMSHPVSVFLRYGSLLLTPAALLADMVSFARLLLATYGRVAEADRAV